MFVYLSYPELQSSHHISVAYLGVPSRAKPSQFTLDYTDNTSPVEFQATDKFDCLISIDST